MSKLITEKDAVRIAKLAIEHDLDYEGLKYSDEMYGCEDQTDNVWKYVEECKTIGEIAFDKKYLNKNIPCCNCKQNKLLCVKCSFAYESQLLTD